MWSLQKSIFEICLLCSQNRSHSVYLDSTLNSKPMNCTSIWFHVLPSGCCAWADCLEMSCGLSDCFLPLCFLVLLPPLPSVLPFIPHFSVSPPHSHPLHLSFLPCLILRRRMWRQLRSTSGQAATSPEVRRAKGRGRMWVRVEVWVHGWFLELRI